MRPVHVYVAGPLTTGDRHANVATAVAACRRLVEAGHLPFTPHLHDLVDPDDSIGYENWLAFDFAWIERCDALVRLPGRSSGADREVFVAGKLGIPVFDGVDAFLAGAADIGPREVRLDKSVVRLGSGELRLHFTGPDGEELSSTLSRSEARELMGQIAEGLDGEPREPREARS